MSQANIRRGYKKLLLSVDSPACVGGWEFVSLKVSWHYNTCSENLRLLLSSQYLGLLLLLFVEDHFLNIREKSGLVLKLLSNALIKLQWLRESVHSRYVKSKTSNSAGFLFLFISIINWPTSTGCLGYIQLCDQCTAAVIFRCEIALHPQRVWFFTWYKCARERNNFSAFQWFEIIFF